MAELATIARPYAEALYKACTDQAGVDLNGATAWVDELAAIAANPQLRQLADNPKTTPEQVLGEVAGSLPVVAQGCKASALLGDKGCETNGYSFFDKIAFWKTPIAEGGKYVPYSRWTQDYIAIMGGR